MWDTVDTTSSRLSHDMPCALCGHGRHTYLACSDTCTCRPDGGTATPVATRLTA